MSEDLNADSQYAWQEDDSNTDTGVDEEMKDIGTENLETDNLFTRFWQKT